MKKGIAILLSSMFLLTGCGNTENGGSSDSAREIIITLHPDVAPITCENFENHVKNGDYDGVTFHRVVDGFMAQGGDPDGTGYGGVGEPIKGEFSSNGFENNMLHKRGVVSMARSQDPNSATSQFFICYDECAFLDGDYAAFGQVTQGMEIVDDFLKVTRSVGSDGAVSYPTTPIIMEDVNMIGDDASGNPRVQIIMNDFLNN